MGRVRRVGRAYRDLWNASSGFGRLRLALSVLLPVAAVVLFAAGHTVAGVIVAVVVCLDMALVSPAMSARAAARRRGAGSQR